MKITVSVVFVDNAETEDCPDETIALTAFTEEIRNIWTEIEAIRRKIIESHQLKEKTF